MNVGLKRPWICALVLAVGTLGLSACGGETPPKSDAQMRDEFKTRPWEVAEYIAKENALHGYTRARVVSILGSNDLPTGIRKRLWTNDCSGSAECYELVVEFDEADRVRSARYFFDG